MRPSFIREGLFCALPAFSILHVTDGGVCHTPPSLAGTYFQSDPLRSNEAGICFPVERVQRGHRPLLGFPQWIKRNFEELSR